MRVTILAFGIALIMTGASPALARGTAVQPRVTNGRLNAQPAGIGYAVAAVNRNEVRACCTGDTWISDGMVFTNGRLATCGLEPSSSSTTRRSSDQPAVVQNPVRLEGPDSIVVLFRVEEKAVQRIRIVSPD